ncbi:Adenylate kinase [hydrothermal vent metagenome]|uniref:Adenylate kinase n=1 Tax=hydrothermal vent metagenome TaxID=652676 RepID=A0A1W1BSK6_9ZZZZ
MAKKLILLIGAPGSGKTTDGSAIAKNHPEITAYSLGKLLEDEAKKDTKLGKINRDYISKGELIPTAIVIDTIMEAVKNAPTDIVLLDGFPRKEKQMKIFADILSANHTIELDSVIEIRVSEAVAKERVLGRSDRADDQEDIFNNRMKIYQETISNIEEFYDHDNILKIIDGEQEVSTVINDIDEFLKSHIALTTA